jgi:hypothetical protein
LRGTATVEIVDGVLPEYFDGARKLVPAESWDEFEKTVNATSEQMARVEITPHWAKLMDFETRVPSFLEEMIRPQGGGPS